MTNARLVQEQELASHLSVRTLCAPFFPSLQETRVHHCAKSNSAPRKSQQINQKMDQDKPKPKTPIKVQIRGGQRRKGPTAKTLAMIAHRKEKAQEEKEELERMREDEKRETKKPEREQYRPRYAPQEFETDRLFNITNANADIGDDEMGSLVALEGAAEGHEEGTEGENVGDADGESNTSTNVLTEQQIKEKAEREQKDKEDDALAAEMASRTDAVMSIIRNPEEERKKRAAKEAAQRRKVEEQCRALDTILAPGLKGLENLSDPARKGEREEPEEKHFTGSVPDYAFIVQREVEEAGAREMLVNDPPAWKLWLEEMGRKHAPFSQERYSLFRWICEGKLSHDKEVYRILLCQKLVEMGKMTQAKCDHMASQYLTIKFMYGSMEERVNKKREKLEAKQNE